MHGRVNVPVTMHLRYMYALFFYLYIGSLTGVWRPGTMADLRYTQGLCIIRRRCSMVSFGIPTKNLKSAIPLWAPYAREWLYTGPKWVSDNRTCIGWQDSDNTQACWLRQGTDSLGREPLTRRWFFYVRVYSYYSFVHLDCLLIHYANPGFRRLKIVEINRGARWTEKRQEPEWSEKRM